MMLLGDSMMGPSGTRTKGLSGVHGPTAIRLARVEYLSEDIVELDFDYPVEAEDVPDEEIVALGSESEIECDGLAELLGDGVVRLHFPGIEEQLPLLRVYINGVTTVITPPEDYTIPVQSREAETTGGSGGNDRFPYTFPFIL